MQSVDEELDIYAGPNHNRMFAFKFYRKVPNSAAMGH